MLRTALAHMEPTSGESPLSVLVVAGEASSDEHAAMLVSRLCAESPGAQVFGMGGSALRAAGMDTVVDSEHSASVMGLTELLGSVRKIIGAYRTLVKAVDERKPQLVVLVDFPDFNLFLARRLHRKGIKVFYFISPQLWAWRTGRIKTIKKYITRVAPIFPFEEAFYTAHGVDAEYVGHPFLDRPASNRTREQVMGDFGLDPARPVVALLPGSRKSEVERLMRPMAEAFALLQSARPGLQAVVPVAKTLRRDWVQSFVPEGVSLTFVPESAAAALQVADAALIASGTVTVEAALSRTPCVVVYKLAPFTFRVAKLLVRGVKHFAMINLIAGEKIVEELLQDEVTPERMASEIERLLGNLALREQIRKKLDEVRMRLAYRGGSADTAAGRAAVSALSLVRATDQKSWRKRVAG